jgi:NACHT domain
VLSVKTEHIKTLEPVRMDAFSRPECLPGTRLDILEFITHWLTTPTPQHDQNILWLHGPVGSGKSTLSTTIAERFRELGRLGAFIFFNRDDPTRSDPAVVVRTLAHQLATFDHYIASAISTKIETLPRIGEASIRLQFANLLVEPLLSFAERHTQGPIIIVFDGLDECGNMRSRKELIERLAEELAKLPPIFRIFITSRAESDIEAAFAPRSNILRVELDVTTESSAADIVVYLRHRMAKIRKSSMYNLPADWPGEERIQALARHSAGLFVWASTAATFIEEGHNPEEQLDILLSSKSRNKAESALDALYATALDTAGKWDNDTFTSDFCSVLGTILVARTPLSDQAIDQILGLSGYRRSQFVLSRLGCLLHWRPGQRIRVLHTSIADYLSDSHRCGNHPWFIDVLSHSRGLALACLRIMKVKLRFNICRLQTSYLCNDDVPDLSARAGAVIGDHLSYSCRFWADHLQTTSPDDEILEEVQGFLHNRLLYWLEVLSLIKGVPLASPALLSTSDWLRVSTLYAFLFPKTDQTIIRTTTNPLQHLRQMRAGL